MPSMILQPIVENCVNHGIREMAGEGRIWLSVYEMDGCVCISIGDNGKGMSKETINKILSGTYREERLSGDSNGVAMDNVIARLRLFTGNDKVLDIFSEGEGMGTEFVIYLKHKDDTNLQNIRGEIEVFLDKKECRNEAVQFDLDPIDSF